jgi:hypothetical protein
MNTAVSRNLMAEMKLIGMLDVFDQAVTDATRDKTGYTEFLDTLLQAEPKLLSKWGSFTVCRN